MTETAADIVARMAAEHGVAVDPSTRAYRLAKGSSRLAGIEGDETLDLLAELSRRGLVDRGQAVDLIVRHAKETGGDADAMQKRHIGKVKGGLVEWLLSFPALPEDLPDRRGSGACFFDPREGEVDRFDNVATVGVEDLRFEDAGQDDDPKARLLGVLRIGSTMHHVDAIAIHTEEGRQVVDDLTYEAMFDHAVAISDPDHPYETVEIDGRRYVIVVTPFS